MRSETRAGCGSGAAAARSASSRMTVSPSDSRCTARSSAIASPLPFLIRCSAAGTCVGCGRRVTLTEPLHLGLTLRIWIHECQMSKVSSMLTWVRLSNSRFRPDSESGRLVNSNRLSTRPSSSHRTATMFEVPGDSIDFSSLCKKRERGTETILFFQRFARAFCGRPRNDLSNQKKSPMKKTPGMERSLNCSVSLR